MMLDGVAIDYARALRIWQSSYGYALGVHRPAGGDWLWVHYDQLMDGSGCDTIEKLLGVRVKRDFADNRLRRTMASAPIPPEAAALYQRLCDQAAFQATDARINARHAL
jgi:hypothetical protein